MQSVRNFFFYFSPLGGALIGGVIGYWFHVFAWIIGAGAGFAFGCAMSALMIVLSIRARFRADPGLSQSTLGKTANPKPEARTK